MTWEDRFRTAIRALAEACGAVNVQWMLIGGMAVIARGAPRTTEDVDATLLAPDFDVDRFLAACHIYQIVPRRPDVKEMAIQAHILLLRHTESGVELDVSLAWLGFEQEAIGRAQPVDFGQGLHVPVARVDDLIVYKSVAWRDVDRKDIERLLLRHGTTVDLVRVRTQVQAFAEWIEAPERLEQFDALVARVRGSDAPLRGANEREQP